MVTSHVEQGVSAAILAGGRARRFGGADKASLAVGRARIIDRQLAVLAAVADDIRIVANDAQRYAGLGVRVIPDAIAGAGPLGGIYTALLDVLRVERVQRIDRTGPAGRDRLLVIACDLPFVTAALLERLVAESRTGEQVDAVVPRSAHGLEPLCALYTTRCAAVAKERIDRGLLPAAGLLDAVRTRVLERDALAEYDEGALFENVNTPHDHERARGWVELNEKPSEDRITE
jgi:molybdopterin-guanine dinucleotide biosynthesis protein A